MHATNSSSLLKILYKLYESYELDPEELLHSANLGKQDLLDTHKRISYKTVHSLWLSATKAIDDPCFGINAARAYHPSDLNALGFAWLSSSTLRQAFEQLVRYQAMLSEFIYFTTSESEESYEIHMKVHDESMFTMAQSDCGLAILLKMCKLNYGDSLKPLCVSYRHSKPACHRKYKDYFDTDVKFSQPDDTLCFSINTIDKPLINSLSNMAFVTDKVIINYLETMQANSIVLRVKQAITQQLPSNISVETISKQLNITPRTLHRHLKQENTSFKEILDNVRFELSKQYIQNQRYSLTEIAFQLGFSDSSSFSRAFKNWSGSSPSYYKKHQ